MSGGISRRRLLGWTGAGAAVAGVGAVSGYALGRPDAPVASPGQDIVDFRGTHQAGIVTPSQNELYFTALDLTSTGKATVQRMLSQWTHGRRAPDPGPRDRGERRPAAQPGSPARRTPVRRSTFRRRR